MKSVRFAVLVLPFVTAVPCLTAANAPAVPAPAAAAPKTEKNDAAEFAALKAKAERGNAIAQYNLGLAFAQGRQTAVNLPEAFAWLTIAAQSGSTGKALDTVLGNMTPKQLADGRRRLEELRSTNPYLKAVATAPTGTAAGKSQAPAPVATPAGSAGGHAPSSPDEARNLYDQLAAVTEEKRQLASDLAVAKKELERAQPDSSSGSSGRGRASDDAPPAQDPSAEIKTLQAQLKEAQAALASRIELADRVAAKAQQAEVLAAERARALTAAQADLAAARAELATFKAAKK